MSARRLAALLVLSIALIEAAWIAVLPPFGGSDEFDHAFRAASVAHGEWEPGPPAEVGRGRLVVVPADLAAAAGAECWSLSYTGVDNCFGLPAHRPGMVRIASAAATYNPGFYWVIGTLARPFHGAGALYAMRAATALFGLAFVGAGLLCLLRGRSRGYAVLATVLALSPMVLYSMAVAAPNGPEMAAGFALWCALIGLLRGGPGPGARWCLGTAGVAAVTLANLRDLGPGFVVIIVALTVMQAPRVARQVLAAWPRAVAVIAVLTLLSAVQAITWSQAPGHHGAASSDGHVVWAWTHPLVWQLQMVGAFPLRNQPAPAWTYALFLLALVGFLGAAFLHGTARQRWLLATLAGGVLAMPFVLTALTYSSVGVIWQGRYVLPLAVGLPLLAGEALRTAPGPRRGLEAAAGICVLLAGLGCVLGVRDLELSRRVVAASDWRPASVTAVVAAFALAGLCVASTRVRGRPAFRRLAREAA